MSQTHMASHHQYRGRIRLAAVIAALASILAAPLIAGAVGAQDPLRPADSMPVEEVEVRLVLVHATVLDARGEAVTGLAPEDFTVTEDGVPQEIVVFGDVRQQRLDLAFLLDISGSMAVRDKLQRSRRAIRRFALDLRPEDRTALLIFADGEVAVACGFTADRGQFLEALARQEAYGRTAILDALARAPGLLATPGRGRKGLVLVTDGIDNASNLSIEAAVRQARQVAVPIYIIGIADRPVHRRWRRVARDGTLLGLLEQVSGETGGDLFPVFDGDEIERGIATVQERLRAQYVLGYRPAVEPGEPGFRAIGVRTRNSRWRVEARRGYEFKPR